MFRDPLKMLHYEAKRRPEIAKLVADTVQQSEDDIHTMPLKLPWMRQALLMLKRQQQASVLEAEVDRCVVRGETPDPIGRMYRWLGPTCFIKIGRTQLEISDGDLLWLDNKGVWIDTIYTTVIDPLVEQHTVACRHVTWSGYRQAVRERVNRLHPVTTSVQDGVRFYRPG